ncbi:hypothetical protein CEXT_327961 [Caerostris extrusa]|uniref:Uncharacterized protein n=1 Tax=Caerostris extrusa TaxID=172846 RepID=A0AAV4Q361_CAEEX|nr:hypothetical protein CEXT_327961 [Caerostris extrusa]
MDENAADHIEVILFTSTNGRESPKTHHSLIQMFQHQFTIQTAYIFIEASPSSPWKTGRAWLACFNDLLPPLVIQIARFLDDGMVLASLILLGHCQGLKE